MSDHESPHDRYVVVARRYRPKSFAELVGQPHISQALGNAIETGRIGHAYLFTGARGTGKTSTARIFAKCLNDPSGPTIHPDLDSDIAKSIDTGEDIDVIEIDAASNRGIDEIRKLRSNATVRPSRARFKIYVLDEVHMLSREAFNALLKTLEEPPEHVKFILCTTDPEKVPITILSRCQRFDFIPVAQTDIVGRLQEIVTSEHAKADEDALQLLARRAAGSMRDSQSLLEQVLSFSGGEITIAKIHAVLGSVDDSHIADFGKVLSERNAPAALELLDRTLRAGIDAGQLAEQLLGYFRDLMVAAVGGGKSLMRYSLPSDYEILSAAGSALGLQTALAIVQLLDQAVSRMRQSIHGRILLESAIIQICYLPDLEQVAALAQALSKKPGASPAPARRPAAAPTSAAPAAPATNAPTASASSEKSTPHTKPAAEKKNGEAEGVATPLTATQPRFDPPQSPGSSHSSPLSSPVSSTAMAAASATSHGAATAARPSAAMPAAVAAPPAVAAPSSKSAASPDSRTSPTASRPATQSPAATPAGAATQPAVSTGTPAATAPQTGTATSLWLAALAKLDDLTADHARAALEVTDLGNGRWRVAFGANQQLTRASCEKAERRLSLERVLSEVTGQKVQLEFTTVAQAAPVQAAPPVPTAVARTQRMRMVEQDPLVRQFIEIFEGEIVRVDEPRPAKPA